MSLKDLFSRNRTNTSVPAVRHHAVIDTSNDTLVAVGTYLPALVFLSETMMDTMFAQDVVSAEEGSRIQRSAPRAYPEWSLDYKKWALKKTNHATITEAMRERSTFAAKKLEAITYLMYSINRQRIKLLTGFLLQETIYAQKEEQARHLKDTDFKEPGTAPYVTQYAEESGVSLAQAVDEILFQAQLDREHLAKTERLRLALFKKIKLAGTAEEIQAIVDRFRATGLI